MDIGVFVAIMVVLLLMKYSDMSSHTDFIHKYGVPISWVAGIAFLIMMYYVIKIMIFSKWTRHKS